jgi:hypothetical protein
MRPIKAEKDGSKFAYIRAKDWVCLCAPRLVTHQGIHLMFDGKMIVRSADGRIRVIDPNGNSHYLPFPKGVEKIWSNKIAARDKWRKSIVGGFRG